MTSQLFSGQRLRRSNRDTTGDAGHAWSVMHRNRTIVTHFATAHAIGRLGFTRGLPRHDRRSDLTTSRRHLEEAIARNLMGVTTKLYCCASRVFTNSRATSGYDSAIARRPVISRATFASGSRRAIAARRTYRNGCAG